MATRELTLEQPIYDLLGAFEGYVAHAGAPEYAVGGGSVLAGRWLERGQAHRTSTDLDVFLSRASWEERCWGRAGLRSVQRAFRQVPGCADVKVSRSGPALTVDGIGTSTAGPMAIDLVPWTLTKALPAGRDTVRGHPALDTRHILAAKLAHRGPRWTPRDVYDLAVALKREPEEAASALLAQDPSRLRKMMTSVRNYDTRLSVSGIPGATDDDALAHGHGRVGRALLAAWEHPAGASIGLLVDRIRAKEKDWQRERMERAEREVGASARPGPALTAARAQQKGLRTAAPAAQAWGQAQGPGLTR